MNEKVSLNAFKLENTSVSNFLSILLSVAKTMQAYRKQSCVQLDIKPENILVTQKGTEEYEVEFLGLEHCSVAQKEVAENVSSKKQNSMADRFTLGVVLFNFIMGRPPQNLERSLIADYQFSEEIKSKFNKDEDLLELVRELFRKTIAVDPSRRYQTDDAFIKKLRELRDECSNRRAKSDDIKTKLPEKTCACYVRGKELEQIDSELFIKRDSASIVSLYGEDGLGKTAIALKYGQQVETLGRTVVWLCYQNNFQETFSNDKFFEIENFTWSDFRKSNIACTAENYFAAKKIRFGDICKSKHKNNSKDRILMIIDDVDEEGINALEQLSKYPCDILVTSKQKPSPTIVKATIEVKSLLKKDAVNIWKDAYWQKSGNDSRSSLSKEDDNMIETILDTESYRSPLLLKLLANVLYVQQKTPGFKETLNQFLNMAPKRMQPTQESSMKNKNVAPDNSILMGLHVTFLFATIKNNPTYVKILSNLWFVPKSGISYADFEEALSLKAHDVTALIDASWIQCSDGMISLHPVIADVVAAECSEEIKSPKEIICYVTKKSRWYELNSDEENLAWLALIQNCIQVLQPETDVWLTFAQAQLLQATGLMAETAQNLEKSIVCYEDILNSAPDDFWEEKQNRSVLYPRISYNLTLLHLQVTRYLAISGTATHEAVLNYKVEALQYLNQAITWARCPADIAQIQCLKAEVLCELGESKRELSKAGRILDKVLEDQEHATENITLSENSSMEDKQLFFDLAKSHLVAFQLEGRKEKCNLEWMCDCAENAIDIYEKILGATHRQLIFAKLAKISLLINLAEQKRKEIEVCQDETCKSKLCEWFENYHAEIMIMSNQMLKDLCDDKSLFSLRIQKHTRLTIATVCVQKEHWVEADFFYQEIEALQKEIDRCEKAYQC